MEKGGILRIPSRSLCSQFFSRTISTGPQAWISQKLLRKLGTPRPVFTPMCVWGLPMYLVKPLSQDKGSGRYTMYLPFSLYRFLGAKGTDTLCIYRTPCLGRGALPDTWAIPKHTLGYTRVWGCQRKLPGKLGRSWQVLSQSPSGETGSQDPVATRVPT